MAIHTGFALWFRERFPDAVTMPTAFARKRGLAHQTVLNYTSGRYRPRKSQIGEIAERLGIPPEELWQAAGYGAYPGMPVERRRWEEMGEQLDREGDDATILLGALETLKRLPDPTRSVLRLQLRTLADMIADAARLTMEGGQAQEDDLPPPPQRNSGQKTPRSA